MKNSNIAYETQINVYLEGRHVGIIKQIDSNCCLCMDCMSISPPERYIGAAYFPNSSTLSHGEIFKSVADVKCSIEGE